MPGGVYEAEEVDRVLIDSNAVPDGVAKPLQHVAPDIAMSDPRRVWIASNEIVRAFYFLEKQAAKTAALLLEITSPCDQPPSQIPDGTNASLKRGTGVTK
jgi:hypothetical protein